MNNNLGLRERIVVFDFETNGLDASKCQPIEIAARALSPDGTHEEFSCLVSCPEPLPAKIIEITSITDEMLKAEGRPYIDAMGELADFILKGSGQEPYLVGHNWIRFDVNFLRRGFDLLARPFPVMRGWDTAGQFKGDKMRLSRSLGESRLSWHLRALNQPVKGLQYNLKLCCEEYCLSMETLHRAGGDVEMTFQMFFHQLGKITGTDHLSSYLETYGKRKNPEADPARSLGEIENHDNGPVPVAGSEGTVQALQADDLQVAERPAVHDGQ